MATLACAEDWPRFRGPNGSGVSDATGLPTEFGPKQNLVWRAAVPMGRSSPIVVKDRIYLTALEDNKLVRWPSIGKPARRSGGAKLSAIT